jgi:hypothetical protein
LAVTDDLIEAVARAICCDCEPCAGENCDDCNKCNAMENWSGEATAAIRAAAPLILDMAADVVDDAEYAGFVRQLKERFK